MCQFGFQNKKVCQNCHTFLPEKAILNGIKFATIKYLVSLYVGQDTQNKPPLLALPLIQKPAERRAFFVVIKCLTYLKE